MYMDSSDSSSKRTKHVDLIYHHIQELVSRGVVNIVKVTTVDKIDDWFKKPGTPHSLSLMVQKLMLDRR